jgi:hypothetical protein
VACVACVWLYRGLGWFGEEGWPFVAPKSVPLFAWMEHVGDSLWEMFAIFRWAPFCYMCCGRVREKNVG